MCSQQPWHHRPKSATAFGELIWKRWTSYTTHAFISYLMPWVGWEYRMLDSYQTQHIVRWWHQIQSSCLATDHIIQPSLIVDWNLQRTTTTTKIQGTCTAGIPKSLNLNQISILTFCFCFCFLKKLAFSKHTFFFFFFLTTVLSQWNFSHGIFGLPSLGKASYDSRSTQPAKHAGCFSVSIIHWTLTWTTGHLAGAQRKMHEIAHRGVRTL